MSSKMVISFYSDSMLEKENKNKNEIRVKQGSSVDLFMINKYIKVLKKSVLS